MLAVTIDKEYHYSTSGSEDKEDSLTGSDDEDGSSELSSADGSVSE